MATPTIPVGSLSTMQPNDPLGASSAQLISPELRILFNEKRKGVPACPGRTFSINV